VPGIRHKVRNAPTRHAPVTGSASPAAPPGRSCPLPYRYSPRDLARAPDLRAETLYIAGGLYGNRTALDALRELAARESAPVTLVFNGDFNWFDIDPEGFAAVNGEVLEHVALRGNVETEIAGDDPAAGCGCAYPEFVDDADVERSNRIIETLRATARGFPGLQSRLAALPMHLVAEIGSLRAAIVHGDAGSLAGWGFSQEALSTQDARTRLTDAFDQADVRIFASSHTCLPVAAECLSRQGHCVLINNGAAGMPNFSGTAYGVITRIATTPYTVAHPLYGTRIGPVHLDALALHYDGNRWNSEFLANWPPGTPAHASYFRRITNGPRYSLEQAVRWLQVGTRRAQREAPRGKEGVKS
jgi:hypothetical protein